MCIYMYISYLAFLDWFWFSPLEKHFTYMCYLVFITDSLVSVCIICLTLSVSWTIWIWSKLLSCSVLMWRSTTTWGRHLDSLQHAPAKVNEEQTNELYIHKRSLNYAVEQKRIWIFYHFHLLHSTGQCYECDVVQSNKEFTHFTGGIL